MIERNRATEHKAGCTAIGVFGGAFDPVHFGHLRAALELAFTFDLEKVLLVPNGQPPHRPRAFVNAGHRVAMLQLALRQSTELFLDSRELDRAGPSYTYDTLASLREEYGAATPIIFGLGADAFEHIAKWHRADELLQLAHIAVLSRPGSEIIARSACGPPFESAWSDEAEPLRQQASGKLYSLDMTPLAISSTRIRAQIAKGWSPRFLLPQTVCEYIEAHQLYRSSL